jgi:hypothetical protein
LTTTSSSTPAVIEPAALQDLIAVLLSEGYQVIGPQIADNAIVYEPLAAADELPRGWIDHQDGGHYRLEQTGRASFFDYVVGPHSWKRYLFPPRQRLWRAQRTDTGFQIEDNSGAIPRYAFIGVRSCEIHAMQIQDKVFGHENFADPGYQQRRSEAFIVAVNCARPGGTCFCTSMNTGPKADSGFDLALTEIIDAESKRHEFVVEAGSERGAAILAQLPQRAAQETDIEAAGAVSTRAAQSMGRTMSPDPESLLKRNLEHPRWDEVAERCLSCGNCTMVCPTCFCTTVEDTTDLTGDNAERWRHWDSCFTVDFSDIHGGSKRSSG